MYQEYNDSISFSKHAKFNGKAVQYGYDISLLILDQEVSFNSYIQAACLPDSNELNPSLNSVGAIAGWGRTDGSITTLPSYLRNVNVYVANETTNRECVQYALLKNSIVCLGFCFYFTIKTL